MVICQVFKWKAVKEHETWTDLGKKKDSRVNMDVFPVLFYVKGNNCQNTSQNSLRAVTKYRGGLYRQNKAWQKTGGIR